MPRTTRTGSPPIAGNPPPPEDRPDVPLPHERDQASGQTAAQPDPTIAQAHRDLEAGLVDTDLRATPGLDAARREALVAGTDAPRDRSRNK